METKAILPMAGIFVVGLFIGLMSFVIWLLPHYEKAIRECHEAQEQRDKLSDVIRMSIDNDNNTDILQYLEFVELDESDLMNWGYLY